MYLDDYIPTFTKYSFNNNVYYDLIKTSVSFSSFLDKKLFINKAGYTFKCSIKSRRFLTLSKENYIEFGISYEEKSKIFSIDIAKAQNKSPNKAVLDLLKATIIDIGKCYKGSKVIWTCKKKVACSLDIWDLIKDQKNFGKKIINK